MKQSLALLESQILWNQRQQTSTVSQYHTSPLASSSRPSFDFNSSNAVAGPSTARFTQSVEPTSMGGAMKQEAPEGDAAFEPSTVDPPGKNGRSDHAGFYTGATSTVSHLTSVRRQSLWLGSIIRNNALTYNHFRMFATVKSTMAKQHTSLCPSKTGPGGTRTATLPTNYLTSR